MQILRNDFFRFFKGDLVEQWTSIEIGLGTNRVLAQYTANFGWVSLFIIDKILRNAKNILIHYF